MRFIQPQQQQNSPVKKQQAPGIPNPAGTKVQLNSSVTTTTTSPAKRMAPLPPVIVGTTPSSSPVKKINPPLNDPVKIELVSSKGAFSLSRGS
jgi:hypothetical protein